MTRKLYLPQPIVCTYVTLNLTLSLLVKFSPVAFLMFLCIWQYFFIDISILFSSVLKLQENKWQKVKPEPNQAKVKLLESSGRYSFCWIFKLLNLLRSRITSALKHSSEVIAKQMHLSPFPTGYIFSVNFVVHERQQTHFSVLACEYFMFSFSSWINIYRIVCFVSYSVINLPQMLSVTIHSLFCLVLNILLVPIRHSIVVLWLAVTV